MSNEIVSVPDESGTLSTDTGKDANDMHCRPQGLDPKKDFRPTVKFDLIGGNHSLSQFLSPSKGHKHVDICNPTTDSVKPLLEKIKEPSVLLLRGCELLLQAHSIPFQKFKTLTCLEISGISSLTALPDAISEMTQLQGLNLSHLPINQFPSDQFFSNLTNLRSLVLRGCCRLLYLPKFPCLPSLQCLDLSDLLIETFPLKVEKSADYEELRWLILRRCSRIRSLPDLHCLKKLEVLDLSHCTALQAIGGIRSLEHRSLQMLDLSYTGLRHIGSYSCPNLTHLFIRDTKGIPFFQRTHFLVVVDLSRTKIKSLDFLSNQIHLRHLILKDCTKLVNLSKINRLTNLEVLDISGCELIVDLPKDINKLKNIKMFNLSGCNRLKELREGLFDDMPCLEKLDLSKTNVSHLPSFASLTNLQSLNLSHTPVEIVSDLSNLVNLKQLFLENCQKLKIVDGIQRLTGVQLTGLGHLQEKRPSWDGNIPATYISEIISNSNEFHLVSTFIGESVFDRFKSEFKKLEDLVSNIEKKIKPTTTNKMTSLSAPAIVSIHRELKYILKNIDLLECSSNCRSSKELLDELMDAATGVSNDDFSLDAIDLSKLIRVVAKLKLLVPPPKKVGNEEDDKKKKKKKILLTSHKDKEEEIFGSNSQHQNLLTSYDSLTHIQRSCLLYIAAFPFPKDGHLGIKDTMLIQLWYGEGFIDPVLYHPTSKQSTSTYIGVATNNASGQASLAKGEEIPSTINEIALQILKVLHEKGFIDLQESGRFFYVSSFVLNFIKEKAKEECFFDFDEKNGKLTSHFSGSQRACLLKSQAHNLSSCQLWLRYANSSKKVQKFKNIRTLLQVNESVIDLNVEWFSKMRNLIVLHLGSLNSQVEEHIDFVDLKFLKELKNMKLLRLLSLEGFSAIVKLPDSICMLTHLRMLNLRYCCNLEELPAGIGSLENLTHLDLTHCHILPMLPKGLKLLSQLEVLKGFVITYEDCGRQHEKACTLRELLKLRKLRKLNLVVNREKFPYSNDVHVFKKMKSLCNLMITWKKDYDNGQDPKDDAIGHEFALRHSRWKQLKCWEKQTRESETEEPLRSNRLHNLKKLVMCCFPTETVPNWLHPSELKKLEKLYIIGGNLKTLPGGTDQNNWSVKTLRLHHVSLSLVDMDERKAEGLFPRMTSFQKWSCGSN